MAKKGVSFLWSARETAAMSATGGDDTTNNDYGNFQQLYRKVRSTPGST